MGRFVSYRDGDQPLEGYLASPPSAVRLPGVVLVPAWLNVSESMCRRADTLASLGYSAFVVDIFGAGVRPAPPQQPGDVVRPFLRDRLLFRRRLSAGIQAFQLQPECDPANVAAIGYCLGGCGVLELARSGARLRGAVSLHGELGSPFPAQPGQIKAKVLILHGDADRWSPSNVSPHFGKKCAELGPIGRSLSTVTRSTALRVKARSLVERPKPPFIRKQTRGHGKPRLISWKKC